MMASSAKYLIWLGLCGVGLGHSFQFFDIFEGVKWAIFAIFATLLALITVLSNREYKVPNMPKVIWIGFGLFILNNIVLNFYYNTPVFDNHVLQRVGFFTIVFGVLQYLYRTKGNLQDLFFPALIINFVSTAYGFKQFWPYLKQPIIDNYYYSVVGNVNQFAQLLALNLLILIHCTFSSTDKNLRRFSYLTQIMSITMIGLLNCRSIYIALSISMIYFLFWATKEHRKTIFKVGLAGLVFFATLFSLKTKTIYDIGGSSKHTTAFTRIEIYVETAQMILDNPLGVGPDRYEFGYIPYQIPGEFPAEETAVFREPHNEYLRFMAEDGVPATLFMYGLYGFLLLLLYRKRAQVKNFSLYSSFAILWATESMFQFPSNVPYSFTLFAVVFGYMLSELFEPKELVKNFIRVPLAGLAIFLGIMTTYFTYAKRYEDPRIISLEHKEKSCLSFPGVWRNCQLYYQILVDKMFFQTAKDEIFQKLEYQPFFYPGLFYWARMHANMQNVKEACYAAKVYNQIFANQAKPNLLKQFYEMNCRGMDEVSKSSLLHPIYRDNRPYEHMLKNIKQK